MGIQGGWANLHQGEYIASRLDALLEKEIPGVSAKSINVFSDTGLAGRIFAGYQFNPYFAIEMGYYRFNRLNVNTDLTVDLTILDQQGLHIPVDFSTQAFVKTDAFDLIFKGILPCTDRLNLYGKLGVTYLEISGKVSLIEDTPLVHANLSGNPSLNLVYPTAGIGISYDLTKKISSDLSWTHIQRINKHVFPSADFVAVGLLYYVR